MHTFAARIRTSERAAAGEIAVARRARATSDGAAAFRPASREKHHRSCPCGGGCPRCQSAAARTAGVETTVAEGLAGASRELPHLARIQAAFGPAHDLSDVRAHTDSAARQAAGDLSANAFAFGRQIAFREEPSLRLAAHEAAHVVQQRAGYGSRFEDSGAWERHADEVADRVVEGRSAADLLAPFAGGTRTAQPRVQFDKDPDAGKHKQGPDVNELAKWPEQALSAWPTLDDAQRTAVLHAMAARYGAEFTGQFKAEAARSKHPDPVEYYYGPGITWITPQKLLGRGYRLAQKDSVHEWWVHPTGVSVVRRWDQAQPESGSQSQEGDPPERPGGEGVEPPERETPPPVVCKDIQKLGDSICYNADHICKIADELGDDPAAHETCEKARKSCADSKQRAKVCGPPPNS